MKNIISLFIVAIVCVTLFSCNKNDDDNDTQGTVRFEASTTSGGITILNYQIREGNIELVNEELIEISQSEWSVSHSASSGNFVTITGNPDLGETLTIKVFYNNALIGSSSSQFNAVVNATIP